jgi:DNA replication protein DnaC
LPLTRKETSLFFRLLVRRYERASLFVMRASPIGARFSTTESWPRRSSIVYSITRTTVNIKGESYRLREKKKAGLLRR